MLPGTARRLRRGLDPSPRRFPVGGVAIWLVSSRLQGPAPTDAMAVQVHASMGGFEPGALTVKAGQAVRVEFSSMDTAFHSDGGGGAPPAHRHPGIGSEGGPGG